MSVSPTPVHPGPAKQAIARAIVTLIKRHVGRGPTNARAYIEDDMVTVLLSETLTTVERTLADAGSGDVVSTMRDNFDSAMCAEAIRIVETETGREVEAFMSGHAIDAEYSVFCFVLAAIAEDESGDSPCNDPGIGASDSRPAAASAG